MNNILKIVRVRKSADKSKHGKRGLLLELSAPAPEDCRGLWIHLPSLHTLRIGRSLRETGGTTVAVRGIGKDMLRSNDLILPLNGQCICSRVFYGFSSSPPAAASGELRWESRSILYRITPPAASVSEQLFKLELEWPVCLAPGKELVLNGGSFTPLTVFPWQSMGSLSNLLAAQGWLPTGALKGAGTVKSDCELSGNFVFSSIWLDWVRERLKSASHKEGGTGRRDLSGIALIPPYVADDLLALFVDKGWFSVSNGVLLDSTWDYRSSLSPMNRGLLEQMKTAGYLIEKINDSPRGRGLSLLCRTGLAVEIEEGVFVESGMFKDFYNRVAELRRKDPEIGLGELAVKTGMKKRFLISLLQYGDSLE